ncbi:TniQ family protein [Paraburkholderia sp. GAS334]|uniref:TniQ family protein n=1 Tax=Paraburkholderia sp. GAS334 TaxID=3035131 RepID=UPI003D1A88D5
MARQPRKVTILNLPPFLPGETIVGHFIRICIENCVLPLDTGRYIFGRSIITYPWTLSRGLEHFIEKTGKVLGDSESMIANQTIFPAIAPFLSERHRQQCVEDMLTAPGGKASNNVWRGRTREEMKWCFQCIAEDTKKFGHSYWHREHQFALVTRCLKHKMPLHTDCGECAGHRHKNVKTRLPVMECICGKPARLYRIPGAEDLNGILEERIHGIFDNLLADPIPEEEFPFIAAAMQTRATELGLMNDRGIQMAEMKRHIDTFNAPNFFHTYAWRRERRFTSIRRHLYHGTVSPELEFNVILVAVLFESPQQFRETIRRKFKRSELPINIWEEVDGWGRETIDLDDRPNFHSGARKVRSIQAEERDERASKIIQRNYEREIVSLEKPKRMTKSELLRSASPVILYQTEKYPRSAALLAEYTESDRAWSLRRAEWLLTNPGQYDMAQIRRATKLKAAELESLLTEIRNRKEG